MSTVPKIIPDKIHIERMRVLSGNISCPPEIAISNHAIEGYEMFFKAETLVNYTSEKIRILFSVKFEAIKEGNKFPISAEYTIEYIISIDNFKDYVVTPEEGKSQLHGILGGTLMGIIYSTSRGILASRAQGTILEGIILPVIDPKVLLNDGGYKAFSLENIKTDLRE